MPWENHAVVVVYDEGGIVADRKQHVLAEGDVVEVHSVKARCGNDQKDAFKRLWFILGLDAHCCRDVDPRTIALDHDRPILVGGRGDLGAEPLDETEGTRRNNDDRLQSDLLRGHNVEQQVCVASDEPPLGFDAAHDMLAEIRSVANDRQISSPRSPGELAGQPLSTT